MNNKRKAKKKKWYQILKWNNKCYVIKNLSLYIYKAHKQTLHERYTTFFDLVITENGSPKWMCLCVCFVTPKWRKKPVIIFFIVNVCVFWIRKFTAKNNKIDFLALEMEKTKVIKVNLEARKAKKKTKQQQN